MPAVMQETDRYLESFERFERAAGGEQPWLRPIRRAAIARFCEVGFPTTRDEDWRFTSVEAIAKAAFAPARDAGADPTRKALAPFLFGGPACPRLVFVNGRYAPGLSATPALPARVVVAGLAQALATERAGVEQHLARYADYRQDAFAALNTAFIEDGAFVVIPRGTVLEEPIHLLYVATEAGTPTITHPRNLIVAEEDSQAAVVEDYVSLTDEVNFSNAVTELVVGQNCVMNHYLIAREGPRALNVSTLRIQQGRSSNVASHSVLAGGALVRNNIHPVMAGEGGECLINGLFMATGRQHMDNYMKVEHAAPRCESRQFYHGILDGHSHGVFHGRIIVHPGAQKTDAKQTNRNVLLSEDAQIDTKPQLEIYADDVKCTHGATIGQIDEDAIFYLRSRGLAAESARAMLLFAFANESLQRMKAASVRRHLEDLVTAWLPQGKLLEAVR